MTMAIQPRKASWIMAQRWFARDALDFTLGMRRDYGDLIHLPAPFGLAQYLVYHPDHVYTILVNITAQGWVERRVWRAWFYDETDRQHSCVSDSTGHVSRRREHREWAWAGH